MNVTGTAPLPHRALSLVLAMAVLSCAALLVGPAPPARAAIYVVKQCNPATTHEHDWLAPTTRGDVLWGEARCNESSMHLHALSFRRIGLNEGISWVAFAPEGTSFTHWSAGFMGSANSADGILHGARVCWDYFCQRPGPYLLLGLHSPSTPIARRWDGIGAMALVSIWIARASVVRTAAPGPCSIRLFPCTTRRSHLTMRTLPASPLLPGAPCHSGRGREAAGSSVTRRVAVPGDHAHRAGNDGGQNRRSGNGRG